MSKKKRIVFSSNRIAWNSPTYKHISNEDIDNFERRGLLPTIYPKNNVSNQEVDEVTRKAFKNEELDISSDKEMGQGNAICHLTNDVYFVHELTNDWHYGKKLSKLQVKKGSPRYYYWLPRKKKKQFKKLMNL